MTPRNGRKQLPLCAEKGDHNDFKTSKPCELVMKRSTTGKSSVEPLLRRCGVWSKVIFLLVLCPRLLKNELLISCDMHTGITF